MSGDKELALRVMEDFRQAELPDPERALMEYAEKLTLRPCEMTPLDVAALRAAGVSDPAILDASHVIGYFNYINRLADALGVDLEPGMPPDPRRPPDPVGP